MSEPIGKPPSPVFAIIVTATYVLMALGPLAVSALIPSVTYTSPPRPVSFAETMLASFAAGLWSAFIRARKAYRKSLKDIPTVEATEDPSVWPPPPKK